MAEGMIVNGKDLSIDKISFTKPKINTSGGKNVGLLNNNTKKTLFISTPLMLTWGLNENDYDGSGKKSYDLSLQFPRNQDANYSEDTEELLNNLANLEAKMKADAIVNCKEWFNKNKMTEDVIDALWTPMLKYPKNQETGEPDKSRAPSLRVKIPYYDGVFKIELYDTDREQIFPDVNDDTIHPMQLIEKGQNIAVVIQNGGIWFANGKFGTTWKLVQAVVQPRASLYGKCHIKLDTKDADRLKQEATEREEPVESGEVNNVTVDDSDEEQDMGAEESKESEVKDEDAPDAVSSIEPIKKRRAVKKKKEEA